MSHGSRDVVNPTAVGSQATFSAYLGNSTIAESIVCTVAATAWENDTHAPAVYSTDEGNCLNCSDGLVAS